MRVSWDVSISLHKRADGTGSGVIFGRRQGSLKDHQADHRQMKPWLCDLERADLADLKALGDGCFLKKIIAAKMLQLKDAEQLRASGLGLQSCLHQQSGKAGKPLKSQSTPLQKVDEVDPLRAQDLDRHK